MAERLAISRGYMSQLVAGTRAPSLSLASAIARITEGAVPVSTWTPNANEAAE